MNNKILWDRFGRGDKLSIHELTSLIDEIERAKPYLENRSGQVGNAVLADAILTQGRLKAYREEQWKTRETAQNDARWRVPCGFGGPWY